MKFHNGKRRVNKLDGGKEKAKRAYHRGLRSATTLEITEQGGVQMLHDDAVDLSELGTPEVTRASNVEFDNASAAWYVDSARTGKRLASGFKTRAEALAWEKSHYSPGGAGWAELTDCIKTESQREEA